MSDAMRVEIMLHAIRWGLNMITEALSNHGRALPMEARKLIQDGQGMIWEAERIIRRAVHD